MTYKSTLAILRASGILIPYAPRLRHDQQPGRYIYLTRDAAATLAGLGLAPGEEAAEPQPRQQAEALFSHFCAHGAMVRGHDYERRGDRPLWLWRTRSLRIAGCYLGRETFVVVTLAFKVAFTPKMPAEDRLRAVAWYARGKASLDALGLSPLAFSGEDPHAP